jgi:hypothetical protein
VEPVSHWYKSDEPGKPAVPSTIKWSDAAGNPIPGLHVFYPEMSKRGVGSGASPAAEKRTLVNPFAAQQQASEGPTSAAGNEGTGAGSLPAPTLAQQQQKRLFEAQRKLAAFTPARRAADPFGYAAAQRELKAAATEGYVTKPEVPEEQFPSIPYIPGQ